MTGLEIITFTALIKKSLDTISASAWSAASKGGRKILLKLREDDLVEDYVNKSLLKVVRFRSILNANKDVFLDDLYHPLTLRSEIDYSESIVKNGFTMENDECVCISGLAGQGKTTIMRKLFIEEIKNMERFPFFVTLRHYKYNENTSCEDLLLEHFKDSGIDTTLDAIKSLLKSRKIVVYFDGFDEVPIDQRSDCLKMISRLYRKYGCASITTSRPNTEILREAGFNKYSVVFLKTEDIKSIIHNKIESSDARDYMYEILDRKDFIMNTIKTPILVDIFILTYPSFRDMPDSIVDFYERLFSSLIYQHDAYKNFIREKKSNLPNSKLESCFNCVCFFSLMDKKSDLKNSELTGYFDFGREYIGYEGDIDNLKNDIIDGTNLIVPDGYDNYVFVHRSIQEYFAAKCVKEFDDDSKVEFYNMFTDLKVGYEASQLQVLSILYEIEPFSFCELFLIPLLKSTGYAFDGEDLIPINEEEFRQSMMHIMIGFDKQLQNNHISVVASAEVIDLPEDIVNINLKRRLLSYFCGEVIFKDIEFDSETLTHWIISNQAYAKSLKKALPTLPTWDSTSPEFTMAYNSEEIITLVYLKDALKKVKINLLNEYIEKDYKCHVAHVNNLNEIIKREYHSRLSSKKSMKSVMQKIKPKSNQP